MFHVIWYVVIGLFSGLIAKSVMHEHMSMMWMVLTSNHFWEQVIAMILRWKRTMWWRWIV